MGPHWGIMIAHFTQGILECYFVNSDLLVVCGWFLCEGAQVLERTGMWALGNESFRDQCWNLMVWGCYSRFGSCFYSPVFILFKGTWTKFVLVISQISKIVLCCPLQRLCRLAHSLLTRIQWSQNSSHYLLSLWSRMVAATPYFKPDPTLPSAKRDSLLEAYVPKVILSFLDSNTGLGFTYWCILGPGSLHTGVPHQRFRDCVSGW